MNKPKPEKPVPLSTLLHDPEKMLEAARLRQAEAKRRKSEQSNPVDTRAKQTDAKISADIIKLPWWGNDKRGIPNEIVRSALFNIRNHRLKRRHLKDEVIAVIGEGRIQYRGEELRTDDEDVWLQILHLARLQPLGEWIEFTPYRFLKVLGWPRSKHYYDKLRTCLSRMQATAVTIHSQRLGQGVSVSLIRKFEYTDKAGDKLEHWRIWVEPEMKAVFGDVYFTQLEWEQRKQLGPLAKRLHGLYASHRNPFPMKVATLRQGCGSETKALWKFRQLVKGSLEELKTVGFLNDWHIGEDDLVHVNRASQHRFSSDSSAPRR